MAQTPLHEGKLDRAQALRNSRQEAIYDTISANPVTRVIGVEVTGVDLTQPVPDAQVDDLSHALANHNVLFFRDQPELTPEQQIGFARKFGDLHIHPAAATNADHPELFVIHTHGESYVNNVRIGTPTCPVMKSRRWVRYCKSIARLIRAAIPCSQTCMPPTTRCRID